MSSEVRFAAMIPARRAVCSGSPFLTALSRMARTAAALIRISPTALASRTVLGLPLTSTIRAWPDVPTCDRAGRLLFAFIRLSSGEEERQALERHGQIHVLEFHARRHFEVAGRKVQQGPNAGGYRGIHHILRGRCRHGQHHDVDAVAFDDLPELRHIDDAHAASRFAPHLASLGIEQGDDLEPFLAETGRSEEHTSEL